MSTSEQPEFPPVAEYRGRHVGTPDSHPLRSNQMQNIYDTIVTTMIDNGLGEYANGQYILAPVEALTEREYQITEYLIEFAVEAGLGREAAIGAMTAAGLAVRPEPVVEPEVPPSIDSESLQDSRLKAMEDQLALIVPAVTDLVALVATLKARGVIPSV